MIASGHPLPTAAPIGMLPEPPDRRFAKTTRGAGAVAGNHRRRAMQESKSLHLKFEEAELVAQDLQRVWQGLTGLNDIPPVETLGDLVQRTLRKAREIIAAREEAEADGLMQIPEQELPY